MREPNSLAHPVRTTILGTSALGALVSLTASLALKAGVFQFIVQGILYSFLLTFCAVGLQLNRSLWRRWFLLTTSVLLGVFHLVLMVILLNPKLLARIGARHLRVLGFFLLAYLGVGGLISLAGWWAHFRKYDLSEPEEDSHFPDDENSL